MTQVTTEGSGFAAAPSEHRAALRRYILVTFAYWAFTLSDGALRMLVLLQFHRAGYTPLELSVLFLLYEFCGVITNICGGWIGARLGLKVTLFAGLTLQVIALLLLAQFDPSWAQATALGYVMGAQALSGIAKDLTKMSSKSAIKFVVPADAQGRLFHWVALLTGSKNALKGLGFFLGGVLLEVLGFHGSLHLMAGILASVLLLLLVTISGDFGKSKSRVPFAGVFSASRAVNTLSLARFFLFGARDIWFVVGLPLFLYQELNWTFTGVGTFLAVWTIGYGLVQAVVPSIGRAKDCDTALKWAHSWGLLLCFTIVAIAIAQSLNWSPIFVVVIGLLVFGVLFAINSSVHSYLILAFSDNERVSLNVGFYYMANAGGRLVGTFLSGLLYFWSGLDACLWGAAVFCAISAGVSFSIENQSGQG